MWWLLGLALAGPVKKMDKLLVDGEYTEVLEVGEKYLAKNPDAKDAAEVRARLAQAAYALAEAEDTLEGWRAFNASYADSTYARAALDREAELAWEQLKQSSSIPELAAYQARYPEGPRTFEARAREANLAWREAEQLNTEEGWRTWAEAYSDDPRQADARKRQEDLAIAAARAQGEAEALREVLRAYPETAERGALEAEILTRFARLESPCVGEPVPTCARLEAGDVVSATWEEAEGRPVRVEFMRWTATGTKDLGQALGNWAGPWQSEAMELADSLKGTREEGRWSLTVPLTLRTPSKGGGYAVVLTDGDTKVVLSLAVTESWGPATTTATALYTGSEGAYLGMPGAQPTLIAPLNPGQDLVYGRFLYRWGEAGLQRVDLDQANTETLDSGAITGVWASDAGLIWERSDGSLHAAGPRYTTRHLPFQRGSAEMALHPDGGQVALVRSDSELRVRVLDLEGTELAAFSGPPAGVESMRWTRAGLFVLTGPEVALQLDVEGKQVKPTDHAKAKEQITGRKVPWKVTGPSFLTTGVGPTGNLTVYNSGGNSAFAVLEVDPTEPWRLGEGCAPVQDIQATWLPDGSIAARVVREHCGDSMAGPLLVLPPSGGSPVLLESRGEGFPDWLLADWQGPVLLLPDGRSYDGGLNPAPPMVDSAVWYQPGLFSLL